MISYFPVVMLALPLLTGAATLAYEIFLFKGGRPPAALQDRGVEVWAIMALDVGAIAALMDSAGGGSRSIAVVLAVVTDIAVLFTLAPFTGSTIRGCRRWRPLVFVSVSTTILVAGSIWLYALA